MTMPMRSPFVSAIYAIPLLLCACVSQHARADLAADLDAALGRGQTGSARYTARVIDLSNGHELYAVDPDMPFMPASNGKIAVSAAALDFFGSDATFKTTLAL